MSRCCTAWLAVALLALVMGCGSGGPEGAPARAPATRRAPSRSAAPPPVSHDAPPPPEPVAAELSPEEVLFASVPKRLALTSPPSPATDYDGAVVSECSLGLDCGAMNCSHARIRGRRFTAALSSDGSATDVLIVESDGNGVCFVGQRLRLHVREERRLPLPAQPWTDVDRDGDRELVWWFYADGERRRFLLPACYELTDDAFVLTPRSCLHAYRALVDRYPDDDDCAGEPADVLEECEREAARAAALREALAELVNELEAM